MEIINTISSAIVASVLLILISREGLSKLKEKRRSKQRNEKQLEDLQERTWDLESKLKKLKKAKKSKSKK